MFMFWLIFYLIAVYAILALIFYVLQLRKKTLTKLWGKKAFPIWIAADSVATIVLTVLLIAFCLCYPQLSILNEDIVLKIIGLILVIPAAIIVTWCGFIMGMKRIYSQTIFEKKGHFKPVKKGPYKYIKHPIYLGWIMIFFGLALFFNSIYILIFAAEGLAYILIRMKYEEEEIKKFLS